MKSAAKSVLVVFLLALTLHAEPISQLRPTDYVNDFAHVLDSNSVAQLDDICQQIDTKAHAQIAVVTIRSLDGRDIEGYAAELFKNWGIGDKASNRGVLILVVTQDRKYRTEVGYGLEPILPDGKVGGFGREAVPLLKQGDYNGAVLLMTSRVAEVIAQDAGVELSGSRPRAPTQSPEQPESSPSIASIVVTIIIIIIVLASPLRRILFWWFLFGGGRGYGGRGYGGGGWGGGGFGGGGGGGFGGFGGGSSGGGGASGSW